MVLNDCELVCLSEEFRYKLLNWRNSKRIRKNMYNDGIIKKKEHDKWFDNIINTDNSIPRVFSYKGKPLGFVNFTDVDYGKKEVYWGFYIGDKDAPKGSGTAMALLALDMIFKEYNFSKVSTEILGFNKASIRYHEKLGFTYDGKISDGVLRRSNYIDIILMNLTKEKWLIRRNNLLLKFE